MTSKFVQHEPCPSCGSKNNLARYDDGHAVCFGMSCDHYEPPSDGFSFDNVSSQQAQNNRRLEVTGVHANIPDRRISQKTWQRGMFHAQPFFSAVQFVNGSSCSCLSLYGT